MKTLHPKVGGLDIFFVTLLHLSDAKPLQVHGGLLAARGNAGHEAVHFCCSFQG